MDDVSSVISFGSIAVLVSTYTIKSFLDSSKDKLKRLNEKDIQDAVQDVRLQYEREITDLKMEIIKLEIQLNEKN